MWGRFRRNWTKPLRQQTWPTRFHFCIANTATLPVDTAYGELLDAVQLLYASPARSFLYDPGDIFSMSLVVQGNANTDLIASEVVSQEPTGADGTLRNYLNAFYEQAPRKLSPGWAFLDYEPYAAYQAQGDPDPLDSGFEPDDVANGKAALAYLAGKQTPELDARQSQLGNPWRYGVYWLEVSNKPMLQSKRDKFIASAEAGVFAPFDHMTIVLYPFYDDTVDNLVAHYQSYYDAAIAASEAAVAAGYPAFEAVPLFRVRNMSISPQAATISDTQAEAMGKFCAVNAIPNVIFWFQSGADDDKLDGLSVMYDAYVENL